MLFSSKRFDESIGLSYFGARCYDAFIGRFISRDPEEYLDGPNQYVLTKNNPLLWFDPFGLEDYLVVVPGTDFGKLLNNKQDVYMPDWAKGNSAFVKEVQQTFNVKSHNVLTFRWNGRNERDDRTDAAKRLAQMHDQIRKQDPKARFITAGHSHGGNVALESTSFGAKHDVLITMGMPVRDDYLKKYQSSNVGIHYNVYDPNDFVQKGLAGYTEIDPPPMQSSVYSDPSLNIPMSLYDSKPTHFEFGSAGQTIPSAINISVEAKKNIIESHSAVHDENIWKSQVLPKISASYNSNNSKGRCP